MILIAFLFMQEILLKSIKKNVCQYYEDVQTDIFISQILSKLNFNFFYNIRERFSKSSHLRNLKLLLMCIRWPVINPLMCDTISLGGFIYILYYL